MKKTIYILLLLVIPFTLLAFDSPFIEQLMKRLNQYNLLYPQEKVYIQTDKTFYKQTENVWYKIYLVNSNNHSASTISDVVYIELRDPKGNLVNKHEHNVLEGVCNGEFNIREDLAGGLYTLTAYTQWMKNWGEKAIFKKEINIQKVITPRLLLKLDFEKRAYGPNDEVVVSLSVNNLRNQKTNGSIAKSTIRLKGKVVQTLENTVENGDVKIKFKLPADLDTSDGLLQIVVSEKGIEESISRSIPIVLNKIQMQFFPEGGHMVQNVESKIAFEALDEFGKGADVSGVIVDEENNEYSSFSSFHLGMGAFSHKPLPNKKYFAKILQPQCNENRVPLPEARENGLIFGLADRSQKSLSWNIYSPAQATVFLIGQTQGKVYCTQTLNLKKGNNKVEIKTNDFPIGVAVFTLFDANMKEQCERLVFINPENGLKIKLETDKEFYSPKEEVKLTVRTLDKNNKPTSAKLAISVVDEQLITYADDKQDNILSHMFFSSELKGNIQEPYFYFDPTKEKAKEAIDYLMLTHGWRGFVWEDVITEKRVTLDHTAEKIGDVYGYILDKNNKRKQTTVYLIENGNKRRVVETKTTPEGQFAFHNIDLSGNVYIITKSPNHVNLFNSRPQIIPENTDFSPLNLARERITDDIEVIGQEKVKEKEENIVIRGISQNEEVVIPELPNWDNDQALDEVVVTGYGTQRKQSIAAAITSVRQEEIRVQVDHIKNALTGKVAGLLIEPDNLNNIQGNRIYIKGISSFGKGNTQPAVVLNGILLSETINGVYNLDDYVNIQDIESVTVTKTPISDIVPKTANGVIYISTKKPVFTKYKTPKPNYTGVSIPKREFYVSSKFEQKHHNADNLAATVYWNGDVTTDKEGKAILSFTNNDTSSSFRITAEGLSNSTGLVGSYYHNIATTKPFSLDVKSPIFASLGDTVKLPIMVNNNTDEEITAKVKISLPKELKAVDKQEIEVKVAQRSTQTIFLSFSPTNATGEHKYTISANADTMSDEITRSVTVRTVYFPRKMSLSGRKNDIFNFSPKGEMVEGSFRANLVCYTNTFDELFSGLESIFREPYGCFEQTSSSNFPNIMALQAIEASGEDKPEIRKKALEYLDNGYKKLSSYEIKKTGGFEWFGNDPAHTGLTAYGILQFHEMKKVYDKVDQAMVDRARDFIRSRKDGSGHFLNNTRGLDNFAGSPQSISDAYITYAFSETGETDAIKKEYATALKEAYESKDMYRMALMANSAYNMKDMDNHNKLIEYFKNNMKDGLDKMKIETSITRSSHPSATQETMSLWTIAMLKSNDPINFPIIDTCINYIASKRSNGGFYNTQATILSLQAITRYAGSGSKSLDKGVLNISINDTKKASLDLTKEVGEDKEMSIDITDMFNLKENNQIKLNYADVGKALPYTINLHWEYDRPESSKDCAVFLTTKLSSNTVKRNETVRLSIILENKKSEGIPMNVAIIGIPGGMSLQPWQLKELRDKLVFDYYEIIDDNLVIYYSHMLPNDKKIINLDLKAEIPGTYKGMASSAYVYYTNEHKHWVDGISITITE
ncbi:TonB-dependent receptor plug domain-containing protein [Dysgonomonas sp. Marseille-P4677]|uniref:alpha-2-macroglobulin family protein n=1 Tax=Dysgonomonas sp. Marseille-P4677 TaxID=2364790 RepID=UPI001913B176|nr:alpha-2-macroglobulin family protein [Dysgonomonas sp. Marseille-P4677]MBK5722673.1 TonB-dependent receptor plug domain-containing protein [Dysgonomonas sp. Marseille-P4677]